MRWHILKFFLSFLAVHVLARRANSGRRSGTAIAVPDNLAEEDPDGKVDANQSGTRLSRMVTRRSYRKTNAINGITDPSLVDDVATRVTDFLEQSLEGREITDVMNIKRNSHGDDAALKSTILFNSAALFIILTIFSCLRHHVPLVYANNVCQYVDGEAILPGSHGSWFGWVLAATEMDNEEIMDKVGLDALMFLEYLRMFRSFFFWAGTLVAIVLCPIHHSMRDLNNSDMLAAIGIGSMNHLEVIPRWFFWLHAALVWCILCFALHLLFKSHACFLQFRFRWLMRIPEPRSTTLLVENIPEALCSDEALQNYFARVLSDVAVERAYVVRHTTKLREKVKKFKVAKESLLLAKQAWAKEGYAPDKAPKVTDPREWSHRGKPAVEFYTEKVEALHEAVEAERLRIEAAVKNHDPFVCSSAGFVTFTSKRWCRLASREQFTDDTSQLVVSMPPDPGDIVWKDLAKEPNLQATSNLLASVCIGLVMFFWAPMIAITSSLISLDSLQNYVPWLKTFCSQHEDLKTLLQGLLASLALKFLMSMLPSLLMTIIRSFRILKAGAWAQLKLQERLFYFEVIFVLFIVSLGSSISGTLRLILDNPQNTMVILATSLPTASHFYLNYVILGWFVSALELLRYWNLIVFLFNKPFWDPETARKKAEPEDQDAYGMGARMAKVALIATLAVVFMQVLPVIGLVTWAFFGFSSIFYSYLLVFAETKKPDLGGEFWVVSVNQTFFALLVFVLLMTGTLMLRPEGREAAIATACSSLLLFAAWRRLQQFNWKILPFETIAEMDHLSARQMAPVRAETYIQPECVLQKWESE